MRSHARACTLVQTKKYEAIAASAALDRGWCRWCRWRCWTVHANTSIHAHMGAYTFTQCWHCNRQEQLISGAQRHSACDSSLLVCKGARKSQRCCGAKLPSFSHARTRARTHTHNHTHTLKSTHPVRGICISCGLGAAAPAGPGGGAGLHTRHAHPTLAERHQGWHGIATPIARHAPLWFTNKRTHSHMHTSSSLRICPAHPS